METTVDRVKELCKKNGVSIARLEKELGFCNAYLSRLKNGVIRDDRLLLIADYFKVSPVWLSTGKEETPLPNTKIPVYKSVKRGFTSDSLNDVVDWEDISSDLARLGHFFALLVSGDSMAPALMDGDTVIVLEQKDADDGDTVVVSICGEIATCKRLKKTQDGIELLANNPLYKPVAYSEKEIKELPVQILGCVVEMRRKFNYKKVLSAHIDPMTELQNPKTS